MNLQRRDPRGGTVRNSHRLQSCTQPRMRSEKAAGGMVTRHLQQIGMQDKKCKTEDKELTLGAAHRN